MSIWNKILIGVIIVTSLVFLYMSARMLKTHKYWRDLVRKLEADIRQEDQAINGELKPAIDQVRAELNQLITDRHRVWYDCNPTVNINRQTGAVSIKVAVEQPSPHGLAEKTMVYAFEQPGIQQKGRFLGEMKVTGVADKEVTLEPAFKLSPRDADKLARAKRPWTLYDSMPHDNHEIFASLSEEDKKALLPADSVGEYVKNGQPAAEGLFSSPS